MSLFKWGECSPFEPLAKHMKLVQKCAGLVLPMFECVRDGNYDKLQKITEEVFQVEHDADKVKAEIRRTIPTRFALPVYRGDLLALIHVQDDIADTAEDLAFQLTIKKLSLPSELAGPVIECVQQVMRVCQKLDEASALLTDFVEADFNSKKVEQTLTLVSQAEHEEWVADKMQYKLAQKLFSLEDSMKPTDIFLWSAIFQNLGAMANHADKTAERLRRMLVR